ncbi:hypothetical protein ORD22_08115 [Sporosarcina sp. GW1-11]|uniref:hypothetical protein n=1 Tax=Sporosarcina sp. GW1-11 TaxID=2899126 RepID=UPI00294CBA7F|nr:hypothetical protein [Sporosarcina sp. GW1-11]MDV6378211.1 hypothetical protein [Sporosarcina sp. GW1-11]
MKMKLLAASLASVMLIAGCSGDKEESDATKEKAPVEQVNENKDDATSNIKQNEALTKKVQEEKGVIDGQVYEQDDTAVGTLLLDKEVSDKDAKELAERFANKIIR